MKNVTIYTKDYCPYCRGAKQILQKKGIEFTEYDVQFNHAKLEEMLQRSGRMTVPQIFFDEEHIGGYDDLIKYFSPRQAA